MAKVTLEDGRVLNFQGNPTQADIEEAMSVAAQDTQTGGAPQVEPAEKFLGSQTLGNIGKTIEAAGATSRAAIQQDPRLALAGPLAGLVGLSGIVGPEVQQAAGLGAAQPGQVPTFQEQAIGAGQNVGGPSQSVMVNFIKGLVPSAAGLAADMGTNPVDVLSSIVSGGISKAIPQPKSIDTTKTISNTFNKVIKPTITGKKTATRVKQAEANAVSAIDSIVENKKGLKLLDKDGIPVEGRLPQTLDEFSQSIEQTKKSVFQRYDALQQEAGQSQIRVAVGDIGDDIIDAVSSKSLKITSPNAEKFGVQKALDLENIKSLTLQETQDTITDLNASLKAFYRNPNPNAGHEVVINNVIANRLRERLIQAVEKGSKGGKQFKELRRQYGSLDEIEQNVARRAIQESKSGFKVLGNMADVFSAGDIVQGIRELSSGRILKGASQLVLRKLATTMNNPNRAVEKMFKTANDAKFVIPANQALRGLIRQSRRVLGTAPTTSQVNQPVESP